MLRRALVVLVMLVMCACEPRQPLQRSDVVGLADSFQRRLGVVWGTPLDVAPPDGYASDGHAWWQVRYRPGRDGRDRIILVDHDTGWTELPPPGWRIRPGPESQRPTLPSDDIAPGSAMLVVTTAHGRTREELAREVDRLNALATETDVAPLFSLRAGRDRLEIVFGWQDDHGIRRDDGVLDWLRLRTPYREAYWVDLDD